MPVMAQEPGNDLAEEWIEPGQIGIINEDGTIAPLGVNFENRLHIQARQRTDNQQTGSHVYIEQQGDGNVAEWVQNGSNNSFSLRQDGNGNVQEGYLSGEDNLIEVLQQGNNNKLIQELEGTGMDLGVRQFGNEHEFIHIEKSGTSPAYQIRQEGDHGMKIKIEHEKSF